MLVVLIQQEQNNMEYIVQGYKNQNVAHSFRQTRYKVSLKFASKNRIDVWSLTPPYPFLCEKLTGLFQKRGRLDPDVRMVTKTEETLLICEHHWETKHIMHGH